MSSFSDVNVFGMFKFLEQAKLWMLILLDVEFLDPHFFWMLSFLDVVFFG